MISQLPKWIEVGAFIFALIAGCVNAIGFLSFEHQAVSHLTGTATLLGTSFLGSSFSNIIHLLGILCSFIFGSAIAGLLLDGSSLKLGRHYDTVWLLESILLLIALWFLSAGSIYGQFFASAACGLQNALATTYSGAIIRTTHVTGIFTDLGIMLGRFIKGEALESRKAKLFLIIIVGFIFGGTLGAFLFAQYQFMALFFPAIICLFFSMFYRVYAKKYS